jgi:hypothetical protein
MTKVPWFRVVAVSAPPLLVALWLSVPWFQPETVRAEGRLERASVCLGVCADVVAVNDLRLACQADLLGVPYRCKHSLLQPGSVAVTYAALPSVAGLLGRAPVSGVLTRLERDGQTVFRKSVPRHVWSALYGGWVFNAIYWPIAGLIVWRWPKSRFSRRVTWSQSGDA